MANEIKQAGALPLSQRLPCPFYGFVRTGHLMREASGGNGCGLTGTHSPCAMEVAYKKPEWERCHFYNTEENKLSLVELLQQAIVYPNELCPEGLEGWQGVSGLGWFELMTR